jgi:V8-like Glu-specific endopeptidase
MFRNNRQRVILCPIILALLLLCGCQNTGGTRPVYGEDDRDELVNGGPLLCRAASATAAIFEQDVLVQNSKDSQWRYRERRNLASTGWCKTERFADQDAMAYCSAFLIAADVVATAGHCVNAHQDSQGDGLNCNETLIVFDYRMGIDGLAPTVFPESSVYRCRRVLAGVTSAVGADWRVVQLDRPTGREPIALSRGKQLVAGAELVILGHPLGLPMKSATGQVRSGSPTVANSVFVADIDAFQGNSGSPVLQQQANRLEVVGLLTGGHNDSINTSSAAACKTTVICSNSAQCRGELITASEPLWRWSKPTVVEQSTTGKLASHCIWCDHPLRSRHWQCPSRSTDSK